MKVNERSDCVENSKWCPVHLLGSHEISSCTMKNDTRFVCGINGCKMHHHRTLHGSTTSFVARVNSTSFDQRTMYDNEENVLLLIQSVQSSTGDINCFFDNGSSCCLITNAAARRLNLVGKPMCITITTVNGKEDLDSSAYYLSLIDTEGEHHIITVFGVENISNHLTKVDLSEVQMEFSDKIQSIWNQLEGRPSGEIDVLIGQNACGLHPTDLELRGNLKVMSSMFGSGYLLAGTHPAIRSKKIGWNEAVSNIWLSLLQKSRLPPSQTVNKIGVSVKPKYDFFEVESLGVQAPRRCGNCLKCKECSFRGHQLSQQEQYEYHVIESKVKYDQALRCFRVEYPFLEDPMALSKNFGQLVKIAEREERKLERDGLLECFNQEFEKMINLGTLVELSNEDMEFWKGAVHYVSLQHVIKNESTTTPLRIVTNSSLSDKRGVSLNSILMKGPNTLSNTWEILNRWRIYEIAMCSDVTKAYYALHTGEVEKHVRRVVWRYGDHSQLWRIFAFCTVSFGDRPAAVLLEIAIKKTSEMFWTIDPEAAHKIMTDRYVDDIASGGFLHQISRFVGKEMADFKCDGTILQFCHIVPSN